MNYKQLPPLPTPKFTETIRGVPCITVTEHEHLMRTYTMQAIAHATQPAEVTAEPDMTSNIVNETCWKFVEAMQHQLPGPIWNDLKPAIYASLIHYHRAILALRPVQVPMTREQAMAIVQSNPDAMTAIRMTEAHHGIKPKARPHDLWCIHIPGPDEVHAAPSKEAAEHMAAKHNAVMATYYASGAPNLEFAPALESVRAVVIKWSHDQQSHADELREFDYASWGITAQAKKETP